LNAIRRRLYAFSKDVYLDLIIEDENESTTSSSDDVGEAALEECLYTTLIVVDLFEAVHGAGVLDIFAYLS